MRYKFDVERLAYWYFRLNGFSTIENFILHDEEGGPQKTDIDLVALRLPNRREALRPYSGTGGGEVWMKDDERFARKANPYLAFVEITAAACKVNGPWTDRQRGNLLRALRAIGVVHTEEEKAAEASLYETGAYQSEGIEIGIVAVGQSQNPQLTERMSNVLQLTWDDVKSFIYCRFSLYVKDVKREHPQWDLDGHLLRRMFDSSNSLEDFSSAFVLTTEPHSKLAIQKYIDQHVYQN